MKHSRQREILRLIEEQEISTQEELLSKLRGEGFDVTQATVSRDIRELGLSKIQASTGGQKYSQVREKSAMNEKYATVLREGFSKMTEAETILVIHTVSGMAMAVAAALDAMNMDEIAGTIAGDDTIMMAVRSHKEAEAVMRKIEEIIK